MAVNYTIKKNYSNFLGLDLKSSDLTRPDSAASSMLNCQHTKAGSLEKRLGYEAISRDVGGFGLFTYARTNITTGASEPELITVDDNVHKKIENTMTVTYTGSLLVARITISFDSVTGVYRCVIITDSTTVLDLDLGKGVDEVSPVTFETMRSTIDALTDFTATISGSGTISAAFTDTVDSLDLKSAPKILKATGWQKINSTVSNPLAGNLTNQNDAGFENTTATQINNVLFLSNGYDEVLKYDGQTVYRAGLPNPATIVSVSAGAGAITNSSTTHRAQYIQKDAAGNFIEGNPSTLSTGLALTAEDATLTVDSVLDGTGFNTNGAIVNGAQGPVNVINVDDGSGGSHTLKVGDTAYFFDSVSAEHVERNVDSVSGTTITVAGAAVTVADGAAISNNLRIALYRNKAAGSSHFLLEEIPNNSFAGITYLDNTTDANLGPELIVPLVGRGTPPKGKYLTSFRNALFVSGKILDPNSVSFSDVDGPEYFPAAEQTEFEVQTLTGDNITGIYPSNEVVAIFKDQSIHIMSGDFANSAFRVDQLTDDIGCIAHATIQEARGGLMFLSDRGFFTMSGGQLPQPVGEPIEPVFDQQGSSDAFRLRLKRSIALNHRAEQKYICFLPAEEAIPVGPAAGTVYANTNSRIFAYDYFRGAWLEWDNMNMAGGATLLDEVLHFSEKRYSILTAALETSVFRQLNTGTDLDYQDNLVPINWNYGSAWDSSGEPSVYKRCTRLKAFTLEDLSSLDFTITVRTERNYLRDVEASVSVLDFSAGSGGYGVDAYGTASYGTPAEGVANIRLGKGKLKSQRLVFENLVAQQNVTLTGWELEWSTPYNIMIKE